MTFLFPTTEIVKEFGFSWAVTLVLGKGFYLGSFRCMYHYNLYKAPLTIYVTDEKLKSKEYWVSVPVSNKKAKPGLFTF